MIEHPFVYALIPGNDPSIAMPIPTKMQYDPDDPWAVTIVFAVPQSDGSYHETTWVFARDLLIEGLAGPAGAGDTKVWVEDEEKFNMMLRSPDGTAHVWTDIDAVRIFLNHTTEIVPVGGESERVNFDQEIYKLME